MTEWAAKRFWKAAEVAEVDGGYGVTLDGRPVRTPGKALLTVPTRVLADEVAAEWNAQGEKIDPLSMPFTRSANSALEKVTPQHAEVADMLAAYGETDLICYRAEGPEALIQRQAEHWDPLLDWAETALGARLKVASGVMPVTQDPAALDRLAAQVHAFDPFRLTGFHDLVALSGSLVIGFAVTGGFRSPEEAWRLSRVDEDWQIEEWGADEEAAEAAAARRAGFLHAARFFALCG